MKVSAKWRYGKDGKKIELDLLTSEPCCDSMECSEAIRWGRFDGLLNRNQNINIASVACYPEGTFFHEEAIIFCPFCGSPIEVTIIE